jgi:hypothetical protein
VLEPVRLRINVGRARRLEEAAAGALEPLLAPRDEERFKAALQADRAYWTMLSAALLLAVAAGTGFGRLFPSIGPLPSVLWCISALGLAAACVIPVTARLSVRFAAFISIVGALAWTGSAFLEGAHQPLRSLFALLVLGVVAVLLLANIYKRSFSAIALSVIVLHVGANAWCVPDLHGALWLQLPAVMLEFAFMTAAAWRYASAAMLRLPRTTYRISPPCIVPLLDRDMEHLAQIDSV